MQKRNWGIYRVPEEDQTNHKKHVGLTLTPDIAANIRIDV